MDETNNPKRIDGSEWIHDLLDEELSDEAYKFELVSDEPEQLAPDQSDAHTTYKKNFNSTDAWGLFKTRIDIKEDIAPKVVSLRLWWLKYAAIIAIPILVGSVVYLSLNNRNTKSNDLNQSTVKSGNRNKVILVLENGTPIDLKDTPQAMV